MKIGTLIKLNVCLLSFTGENLLNGSNFWKKPLRPLAHIFLFSLQPESFYQSRCSLKMGNPGIVYVHFYSFQTFYRKKMLALAWFETRIVRDYLFPLSLSSLSLSLMDTFFVSFAHIYSRHPDWASWKFLEILKNRYLIYFNSTVIASHLVRAVLVASHFECSNLHWTSW